MHDADDYPQARTIPGLVVYRYDAPLFFANTEDFRRPALAAADQQQGPVRWFVLNVEASVEVDFTALEALDAIREEITRRGAVFALARVGAARTTGQVIPELAGRLDGVAVRVPVEDGSLTDLTAVLAREVTADEVNDAFAVAAAGPMAGILSYSTDPLVSRDIVGDPSSCVFDSGLTQAAGTLVKVFGWYDNEWGYTCRLADLTAIVGGRL